MPLFAGPSPIELAIEKATSETNTDEDWNLILDICDQVQGHAGLPKECLKLLLKRMSHSNPHVVLHSLTLLDACVNNCGKRFHLEVCSREFETDFKRCLQKQVQPKVIDRMLSMIKKWAESKEFREDPQLTLIPTLYRSLQKEYKFPSTSDINGSTKIPSKLPSDPNVVTSNQEEEDIAKAIELSLKESGAGSPGKSASSFNTNSSSYKRQDSNSFYPNFESTTNSPSVFSGVPSGKEAYQVRALYDFEAAEDNELTFKAGEVVVVVDDTDKNWWKGSNHRGEGLFPSNFVTTDLSEPDAVKAERKSVQFDDEVKVKLLEKDSEPVTIDEEKIDRLVHLLHEADPTGEKGDSEELISLEEQCSQMGPLIDEELERVDRRIASLNGVNTQLVEAMNLYHNLMRENLQPGVSPYYPSPAPPPIHQQPYLPHHYPPHQQMYQSPPVDSMGYAPPGNYTTGYPTNGPSLHQYHPQHQPQQQQYQPQPVPPGMSQQQHPPPPAAFASPQPDNNAIAPNM